MSGSPVFSVIVIVLVCVYFAQKLTHEDPQYSSKPLARNDFRVFEFPNVFTREECNALISIAKPNLRPSTIYSSDSDYQQHHNNKRRSSHSCRISEDNDAFIQSINTKLKYLTNTFNHVHEDIEVIKYEEDDFASPHFDTAHGSPEYVQKINGHNGPRWITCIIYLNDDYEGGQTHFPKINKTITPETGKVVVFFNIHPDQSVIEESLHQGFEVTSGTKWIANKWIRYRKK